MSNITIIDLFAGPGGLGEGFSSFENKDGKRPYKIAVSIEMETFAHRTLRLRAFLRHFLGKKDEMLPQIYLDHVQGNNDYLAKLLEYRTNEGFDEKNNPNSIYWLPIHYCPDVLEKIRAAYPEQADEIEKAAIHALREAQRLKLGEDETQIHDVIADILKHKQPDNHTILIGGPPCQAFSTVGRARRKGHVTNNAVAGDDGKMRWEQDHDGRTWLYLEYIKVIAEFQPEMFVMENVKGMLTAKTGKDNGSEEFVWKRIFKDLNRPKVAIIETASEELLNKVPDGLEYVICSLTNDSRFGDGTAVLDDLKGSRFVIRASDYGIPQVRERVILLGIRKDIFDRILNINTIIGEKDNKPNTVMDAIDGLPIIRAKLGNNEVVDPVTGKTSRVKVKKQDENNKWYEVIEREIFSTCTTVFDNENDNEHSKVLSEITSRAHESLQKNKYLDNVSNDASINGSSVKSRIISQYGDIDSSRVSSMIQEDNEPSESCQELKTWYAREWPYTFVLNHEARSQMDTDLARYFYCACYGLVKPMSKFPIHPRLAHLDEVGLAPRGHKNRVSFVDRFKVQIWDQPSMTVTSHISKDGHYYIHPDPSQCRSMTVREAARLQTFPDNYFFEGSRTAQFVQVGNAVPPLLANKIAGVVYNLFSQVDKS